MISTEIDRCDLGSKFAKRNYPAGLVWYETMTGNDARKIHYAPRGVKEANAAFLRAVVHDVVSERAEASSQTNSPR